MLFQLVMILYWLALATWFGGVLFVALAAPVIFRVIGEAEPVLPGVLSVNLEGQHGTLLAGSIVGKLLDRLAGVEVVCAGVVLVMLGLQPLVVDVRESNLTAYVLRVVLFVVAGGVVGYDRWVLWPRIWKLRQEYLDHADEPEVANPAKEEFDRLHGTSVMLLGGVIFLLLGVILFSGGITPKRIESIRSAGNSVSMTMENYGSGASEF
ncbi:MAG TPA: hypothetical protein VFE58_12700 [Tepidisphaeraceae bacterium]|nr:hypothetical protein [Tepidisphaeraceae bacterium]